MKSLDMRRKKKNMDDDLCSLQCASSNEHITVIDNQSELTLCLICKEPVMSSEVSSHVTSSSHRRNLKTLFEICIPNAFCDFNYSTCMKIVTNSKFDLSFLLKNETKYVHRYENHIVCLVCQDILTEVKCCDRTLMDEIFCHLESEKHLNNIKRNVCWVYELEMEPGFFMFHETRFMCSVCDQIYHTQGIDSLQFAIIHLQDKHPQEVNNFDSRAVYYDAEIVELNHDEEEENKSDSCPEEWDCADVNGKGKEVRNCGNIVAERLIFETPTKTISKFNLYDRMKVEKKIQMRTKTEIIPSKNVHPLIVTIHCAEKFKFCIVCQAIIDISSTDSDLQSHFYSSKHKESLETILFQCTPHPFCEKSIERYNEVASVVNNKTGCISQYKDVVTCRICKYRITNISQTIETVKYDLKYHFSSKIHLNIMRENVWWFYYLQFSDVFVAFDDHVTQCTDCRSNLESIPYRVVQCFKDHLQLEQPLMLESTSELRPLENILGSNELICSKCKQVVDIYNDDPEFSLLLHLEKHRDLSDVNKNMDEEASKDSVYICPICQEEILIFNKNIDLSLSLHGCTSVETALNQNNRVGGYDVSTVFENLSANYQAHKDFIFIDEGDICCKLCNCTFNLPDCFQDVCQCIQSHVTELYHKEKFDTQKSYLLNTEDPWELFDDDNDPSTWTSINFIIKENSKYIGKCEHYYFCKICNCTFLYFGLDHELFKTLASHFICKNHKKKLKKNSNMNTIKHDLIDKVTISCLNNPVPIKDSPAIYKKLKSIPGFQLNTEFLVVDENIVYCKLCQVSVPCDSVTKITKHCYSESHSMILVENAVNFISKYENQQIVKATDPCNSKFVYVLKRLAFSYYRLNNPTLTPHLLFIDNNGKDFVCLVCNNSIRFSMDGKTVENHFLTNAHKKKIYSLVCEGPSMNEMGTSIFDDLPRSCSSGKKDSGRLEDEERLATEKENENNGTTVSNILGNMPKEYDIHRDFISIEGNNVTCQLCSLQLLLRKDFETDCEIVLKHLSSSMHQEQYLLSISNDISNSSCQVSDLWEKFKDQNSFQTRLEVQQLNEKNKIYLEKGKAYFICCLCPEYFLYFDEENMKYTFAAHCSTAGHVKKMRKNSKKCDKARHSLRKAREDDSCFSLQLDAKKVSLHSDGCDLKSKDEVIPKMGKSKFVILLNKNYFRLKENQIFCDVCQEFVCDSIEDESILRSHCYSSVHNCILATCSITYVEGLSENNHNTVKTSKFEQLLKEMATDSYIRKSYTVIANLFFIGYNENELICRLCDKKVKFTAKRNTVLSHFISSLHAKNVLKLNCIYSSQPKENNVNEMLKITADYSSESRHPYEHYVPQAKTYQSPQETNEQLGITSEVLETQQHSTEIGGVADSSVGINDRIESLMPSSQERLMRNLLVGQEFNPSSNLTKTSLEQEDILDSEGAYYLSLYETFEQLEKGFDHEDLQEPSNNSFLQKLGIGYVDTRKTSLDIKPFSLTWEHVYIEVSPSTFDDSIDYMCPHCNEVVLIINKDVKVSFELHYKTCHLDIEELLLTHELVTHNTKFVRDVFDCLPETHQKYLSHMSVQSYSLSCNMCKFSIDTNRKDIFESALNLHFHLSSSFHKERETSKSSEEDLEDRPEFKPTIRFSVKETAQEELKRLFAGINTESLENQDVSRYNLDKKEILESSYLDHTEILACEGYPPNDNERSHIQFFHKTNHNNNDSPNTPNMEVDDTRIYEESEANPQGKPCNFVTTDVNKTNVERVIEEVLTECLMVHKDFLSLNETNATCKLCADTLSMADIKNHLTDFKHRRGFLAELKSRIVPDIKPEIKRLVFLNNQLYCLKCQSYITPWSDFNSICDVVNGHLKDHTITT